MGKNVAATKGRRYGMGLAIALLVAINVLLGAWLYEAQGHRVAMPRPLAAAWSGLSSLVGDAQALAVSAFKRSLAAF